LLHLQPAVFGEDGGAGVVETTPHLLDHGHLFGARIVQKITSSRRAGSQAASPLSEIAPDVYEAICSCDRAAYPAGASSSSVSRSRLVSTFTPGPIVDEMAIDLMYLPLPAAGLARCSSSITARKLPSSWSRVK